MEQDEVAACLVQALLGLVTPELRLVQVGVAGDVATTRWVYAGGDRATQRVLQAAAEDELRAQLTQDMQLDVLVETGDGPLEHTRGMTSVYERHER